MKNSILTFMFFFNLMINLFPQTPQVGWVPFDTLQSVSQQLPGIFLKEEATKGVLINFNIPGMLVHEVLRNGQTFHRLSIPGHGNLTEVGKPELPMIGQMVEIPQDVQVSVEIYKEKHKVLSGYTIYPAQQPMFVTDTSSGKFTMDSVVYSSDLLYPKQPSIIENKDIVVLRGHRILFLRINPVQYNPVKKELIIYSNIEVKVIYDKPAQINYPEKKRYAPAYEKFIKSLLINYKDPGRFLDLNYHLKSESKIFGSISDSGSQPIFNGASYLIITDQSFYNSTDPNNAVVKFEKWKKAKGYITKVVSTNNITNGTTADGITAYLKDAYNNWDIPPVYVLFIGDAEFIPTHYKTEHPWDPYNDAMIGTDLYYSTLDGDDYIPDLFIGRLSVDNTSQANIIVDKIINYEKNPPTNPDYYRNILLAALFEDPAYRNENNNLQVSDGRENPVRAWIECIEEVNTYFTTNYNPQRVYAYNGTFANGPQQYENGDPIPTNLLGSSGFSWNGNNTNISNALNSTNGISMVLFRDHGSRDGWFMPDFHNLNVNNLTNSNRTPIIFSITCETGWFDNETDDDAALSLNNFNTNANSESFCETFIRRSNGGTQAIIGASRVSFSGYNDFLAFGLIKAIWSDFNPQPNLSSNFETLPSLSVTTLNRMGQILNYGKCFMEKGYRDWADIKVEFELFHLFGDPEMVFYSREPGYLLVEHPQKIGSIDHQHFVVKVIDQSTKTPIIDAQVVLLQNNQILRLGSTNAAGCAEFIFYSSLSTDNIEITITADNFRPYEGIIGVTANGGSINRLDPDNASANSPFNTGGKYFTGGEYVDIFLNSILMQTVTTGSDGSFGQTGVQNISITIPPDLALGPYNVVAHGRTSDKYAVDLFKVRSPNPVDLFMYSQFDESTWYLVGGDNPVWDNPDIQLYSLDGDPVSSGDLNLGGSYIIQANIRNNTNYNANNVMVSFSWATIGTGMPFSSIGSSQVNVSANNTVAAQVNWSPSITGHVCIQANIYHAEDIYTSNNLGQENCQVGKAASPYITEISIRNPTSKPSYMFLELRQKSVNWEENIDKFWEAQILWPENQLLKPNESKIVNVVIDPDISFVEPGERAWFILNGYINDTLVGGVDFKIEKKMYRTISLHAGVDLPLGSYADNYETGYFVKLDYINPFINRFYLHVIGGLNYFPSKLAGIEDDYVGALDLYIKRNIYIWRYCYVLVEAGPGYYNFKSKGSSAGASAGAGLSIPFGNGYEFGVSSYYHYAFSFRTDFIDIGLFVNYLF